MISKMTSFAQLVIYLKLALAGLRLGLKNRQVGEKWYVNVKYLPLFHHFKTIYQFPKHIIFLVKIVANASLNSNNMSTLIYLIVRDPKY
jgi:hypothetical protein